MKRFSPPRFALLCLLGLSLQSQLASGQTAPLEDTQNWNDVQLTIPLNRQFDFLINGQFRIGNNLTEFVDERSGFGISYKPNKYLTLTPSYLYVAMQQSATRRRLHEHRPGFTLFIRLPKLKGFTITDRNLIERRLRAFASNSVRNRNRIQVEHPVTLRDLKFNVFVSDEVFYDSSLRAFSRNRFNVGASKALNKNLTGELYFMRQSDGRARPGGINVIGTALRFRL